jgi:TonB family protein
VAKAAQDCHASHVPTARGSVLLRLGLAPDGSVSKAEVRQADSGFTSKAFQSCVTEAARRQRFPASSDDETELEIPLRFDPIQ